MAVPLGADRMVKVLRDEGLKVVEHRSWRTHNRNHKGPWGPVHGVMIHHTVTSGTDSSVELCYNGHSSLPGPLCHGVIAKDGTVYMVGNGRANHAGLGDDDVLQAVIDEQELPPDNEANTDGNRYFYGFEAINLGDGKDPWPAAQLTAIAKVGAAISRAHGWSARSVIGHLEWQPGKIDPRGFTMNAMRGRITQRLDTTNEDNDMALTSAELDAIADKVADRLLRTDFEYLAPKDAADWNADPTDSRHWWSGTTVFDQVVTHTRRNGRKLDAILAHLGLPPVTE
jgi:hypothetical protein